MSSKLFVLFAVFALAAVTFAAEEQTSTNERVKKAVLPAAYPYAYGYNYGYAAPYSYGYATPYSYASYNSYPYGHSAYNYPMVKSVYSGYYPHNYGYYLHSYGYYPYAY